MADETSRGTLLAVGAGTEQAGFIRAARNLGYRVVAIDRDPGCAGATFADEFVPIDIADADAAIALARARGVMGVIPAPIGRFLTTVGAVNDALGLRGVSQAAASILVDKKKFHDHAEKLGLLRPRQRVADAIDALIAAREALGGAVVIKPRHGAGSRGVRVVSAEEPNARIAEAYATYDFSSDSLLVEDFVPGAELGVDFVVCGSQLVFLLARAKRISPVPHRVVTGYSAPAEVPSGLEADFARLVGSLGVRHGVFNADVIVGPQGPVILEATARASGLLMTETFVPQVIGDRYLDMLIGLVARGEFSPPKRSFRAVALAFLPLPPGRVAGVDRSNLDPRVVLFASTGEVLRPWVDGAALLQRGYAMVDAEALEQALAAADALAASARLAVSVEAGGEA